MSREVCPVMHTQHVLSTSRLPFFVVFVFASVEEGFFFGFSLPVVTSPPLVEVQSFLPPVFLPVSLPLSVGFVFCFLFRWNKKSWIKLLSDCEMFSIFVTTN